MNNSINQLIPNINIDISNKDLKTISEEILLSKDPEHNYLAALHLGINKIKHLQIIIESKDPLLNYKCVKHCIKTKTLSTDQKEVLVTMHSKIVLNSNDIKIIQELNRFLKYNPLDKPYSPIGINCTKKIRKQKIK